LIDPDNVGFVRKYLSFCSVTDSIRNEFIVRIKLDLMNSMPKK
jgi:hypothetical protein